MVWDRHSRGSTASTGGAGVGGGGVGIAMPSFLSRMANEASAALSDAYGHVVYGDDAGMSARVVWVVHPTRVPVAGGGGGGVVGNSDGMITGTAMNVTDVVGRQPQASLSSSSSNVRTESPPTSSSPSSYLFTEKFDLGLTFLEINGRAYVRTVDVGSDAESAGIQPRDCVQFACVVGGSHFEDLLPPHHRAGGRDDGNNNVNGIAGGRARRRRGDGGGGGGGGALPLLDVRATEFALECEGRGMRTGHDELRDLFAGCTLPPTTSTDRAVVVDGVVVGSTGARDDADHVTAAAGVGPRTPRSRTGTGAAAGGHHSPGRDAASGCHSAQDDDYTIGSNSLLLAADSSIGGMFENTNRDTSRRNNHVVGSRRVPPPNVAARHVSLNVTNAARSAAARCFDGEASDDGEDGSSDCDRRGGGGGVASRSRNANNHPVLETPATPIRGDRVIYPSSTSSPRRSVVGGGAFGDDGAVVEQSLWPVVIVFRRTVQRRRLLSPGGMGWGSSGLSLKGSLFGIPSFRMDDECDRAASLIRQLASSGRRGGGGNLPMDIFCQGDGVNNDMGDNASISPTVAPDGRGGGDIEASTIRGMIDSAVGLGFVRLSKVVVGVSLQGGSGILISRLPDGMWSAPSAIGVLGLGVGLQFGLEVCDFVFIIQTTEGMDHFKRGGNFVVGGNIGAAVANCGREAYGAASLGICTGAMPLNDEIKPTNRVEVRSAPMVAYAKSQGLYFGVSVDGLKFFTRNDINSRTYKFSMSSEMPAKDILDGLVLPPPEAEDLYSALQSVEHAQELTELPRPPDMLRRDAMNDWRFDRSIAAANGEIVDGNDRKALKFPLFSFLSTLNREDAAKFAQFETKFKKFLYCGVCVHHLMPNSNTTRSGLTRREKRTLWLMLPEVGSLRLGFISKAQDNGSDVSMDDNTATSSMASSRADANVTRTEAANVKLSRKYSVSLTDITTLSQDPNASVRLSPDDATEHLRVLAINDVTGKSILFLAESNREAELLFCGLKLLLECETVRLSVRGGVPLNKLGGKLGKGALSPASARGTSTFRVNRKNVGEVNIDQHAPRRAKEDLGDRSKYSSFGEPGTSSDESVSDDENGSFNNEFGMEKHSNPYLAPEDMNLSQLHERNHTIQLASGAISPRKEPQTPIYELGKAICTDIATNISLPVPLALCRVLFLDSLSPVNKTWETSRLDTDYRHGEWTFPPGSVRECEKDSSSEYNIVSRGSMVGAKRTISYNKRRNRELVRLSEMILVEQDDLITSLVIVIKDEMPRRGFQAKACLQLRSFGNQSCEARVVTNIKPVGKNLSDQEAVHKAFVLVLDEMRKRYGVEGRGLLAVFLDVCNNLSGYGALPTSAKNPPSPSRTSQTRSHSPTSKPPSLTAFKDVLTRNQAYNSAAPRLAPRSRSPISRANAAAATIIPPIVKSPRRAQQSQIHERPSTPSLRTIESKTISSTNRPPQIDISDDFSNFSAPRNPVTVEVKPLPKIRLDLLPVPREEDEEEDNSISAMDVKQKRKSKHSRHRHRSHRT